MEQSPGFHKFSLFRRQFAFNEVCLEVLHTLKFSIFGLEMRVHCACCSILYKCKLIFRKIAILAALAFLCLYYTTIPAFFILLASPKKPLASPIWLAFFHCRLGVKAIYLW
jgi:hypothetical protein